jgi:hypothetical protein
VLKVHLKDGETVEVDLHNEDEFKDWMRRLGSPAFQERITGLTIVQKGVQYSLPKPLDFRDVALSAEPVQSGKGGERIVCVTDNAKVQLMVHSGQRAARVTVGPRWRRVFTPEKATR